jgi:hypothetical protein
VVGLGAEAGSWYVTKQHAQNAADAAAYSAGLGLACSIAGSSSCSDAHDYVYRGKEFAAQNSFCNAGDTSYPDSNCAGSLLAETSETVTIDRGTWSGSAWTNSASGSYVRAIVQQTQRAYLASVLGFSTVNIGGQAIAHVNDVKQICALGLSPTGSALTLSGNVSLAGNGCALMSDSRVNLNSAPSVSGSGWAIYGVTGCGPGACPDPGMPYNYYFPPAMNPLSGLNSASFSLTTVAPSPCGSKCTTYSPGAYNKLTVNGGETVHFKPGVYSFSGNVNITGGTIDCPTCSCVGNPAAMSGTTGVNLVITGSGTKLTINSASVTLCAGTNYSGTNAALNGVLIDDQATGAVSVSGNAGTGNPVKLQGAIYAPKTDLTWSGTSSIANDTCAEVIANTLTLTGGAYMSTANCATGTVPSTQVVTLVQ